MCWRTCRSDSLEFIPWQWLFTQPSRSLKLCACVCLDNRQATQFWQKRYAVKFLYFLKLQKDNPLYWLWLLLHQKLCLQSRRHTATNPMIFSNDVKLKGRKKSGIFMNMLSHWINSEAYPFHRLLFSMVVFIFCTFDFLSYHFFQIERHFVISWSDRLSAFIFLKMSFKPCLTRIFWLYMNFLSTVLFLFFFFCSFF